MNNQLIQVKQVQSGMSLRKNQSGVIMLITLISLVIMLLASIALIRSTESNLMAAGNISFRRDVVNQAERAIPQIQTLFVTGALVSNAAREADSVANNYYASIQPSNTLGIPAALMDSSAATYNTNLITNSGVTVRYLIDRMCLAGTTGVTAISCTLSTSTIDNTGCKRPPCSPGTIKPVYRISIRASGPRNTETFIQTTF